MNERPSTKPNNAWIKATKDDGLLQCPVHKLPTCDNRGFQYCTDYQFSDVRHCPVPETRETQDVEEEEQQMKSLNFSDVTHSRDLAVMLGVHNTKGMGNHSPSEKKRVSSSPRGRLTFQRSDNRN